MRARSRDLPWFPGVVLGALKDATGWIQVSPAELRAHAALKIR